MKHQKRFKVLIVFMLIVSLAVTIVGCGGTKTTDDQRTQSTQGTPPSKTSAPLKNYTISWIGGAASTTIEENNWVQQQLEAKFPNVKFQNKKGDYTGSAQGAQNTQLMIAAGELPDCGYFYYDGNKLYDEGLSRSISLAMIKQHTPGYARLLNENPIGLKMNLVKGKTDEFTFLQGFAPSLNKMNPWASGFRLDWLDKVGIKPNGKVEKADAKSEVYWTDKPFTEDQFMDIIDKFTNGDPDGNGKNGDTYGMGGNIYKTWTWNTILGWYGISEGLNVEDSGKTQMWYASTQYKSFLKFANEIYKKGYLDKEFPTLDWAKWNEKLAANKAGTFDTMWLYLNPAYKDRAPAIITDKNPQAKVLFAPLTVGKNGKSGSRIYSQLPWNSGYVFFVNKKVDDDKLSMILKILEYTAFDKEGGLMTLFGKEGDHFKWSGEPLKSIPIPTDEATKNKGKVGTTYYNTNFISEMYFAKFYLTDFIISKTQSLMEGEWTKQLLYPHRIDPFNATKAADINKEVGATITKVVDDFYYKAVTGEINVDSGWDAYIKNLNTAGYDKYLDELNKMPLYKDIVSGK